MVRKLPINERLPLPSKGCCRSKVQPLYHPLSVTALGQKHSFLAGETVTDYGAPPSVVPRGHPGIGHSCLVYYCFLIYPAQLQFHIHYFSVPLAKYLFVFLWSPKYVSNCFENMEATVLSRGIDRISIEDRLVSV